MDFFGDDYIPRIHEPTEPVYGPEEYNEFADPFYDDIDDGSFFDLIDRCDENFWSDDEWT